MDNWLKISGTTEKIILISKKGNSIGSFADNKFVITPMSLKYDTLIAFCRNKIIFKKVFTIDTLNEIVFRLGNIKVDTASIAEILANKGLVAKLKHTIYNFPIKILSYDLTLIKPGADTVLKDGHTIGNLISKTDEMSIRQLRPNSKIVFHAIRAQTTSSRTREFLGFTLITK